MSEIFVTGHRNPDTDSIVASMAYAALRNALGDRDYKAVRIGSVNDETLHILEYFGFDAPMYVHNMRTQVKDLDYDRPPELEHKVSVDLAWRTMRDSEIATMPIVNEDGTLYGMISSGDLASYDMQTIYESRVEKLPIFNLISALEGRLVNEYGNQVNCVSGNVVIALPKSFEDMDMVSAESILVCGDQPEIIDRAIEKGVSCLILCQTEIPQKLVDCTASTCIISTPLDARQAARLIYQAIPIERICDCSKSVECFHLTDYLDDVKEVMAKSRYRCYPVLDEHERVVGTLSRFHLLNPRRKRVVLVDHNEAAQSVTGLDQAEIMEIIDHHRLADIQTRQPISVRNEPVGSTNTIITAMYQEHGVMPSPKMAGLMAAAILSDTVMFKSPTCTKKDIAMAERLARMAKLSLEELGKELFSISGAEGKSVEELFKTDYKEFHIAEQNMGVSQITCVDAEVLLQRKGEFIRMMEDLKARKEFDMVLLMLTDVLLEGTHLLFVGSSDVIRQAFSKEPGENYIFLPGVMSRKKQIIPMLTALWG